MGNLLNGVQTATLTKNTWALCATRHTVKAEATGAEAGKDNILVSYKLESTSGVGQNYHTKDGYLHKIRITIFKDGEIAYQQDVAGDDSGNFITLPPFLITGEGKWEITAKTIAAGDCAKPEGEKNFAYLYAKAPEPVEEEQEEDRAKTAQDLTPLLTVGMVGLAGLVFGKVLRRKKKAAETFEAQNSPEYEVVKEYIDEILEEGIAGFKRNPIEYDLLDMGNGKIEATINTGKGAKKLFNQIKILSQIRFIRVEGRRGYTIDIESLAPDEKDWEEWPARITFDFNISDKDYEEAERKRRSKRRRRAETFEAQAPKKFNCEQIIYDAFYGKGDEKIKKFQEGITKSTPFFNLSFIPPLKGYNESETKEFTSEMAHFLRKTQMLHRMNSATFGALRINGKEFAWVKFSETDDYAIATKSSILEEAKSDLLSVQALKDGTAIGVKGNENLRKMLVRLLDKEEYEKFRTTIIRYGIKHKNYVVAYGLHSLEIAFQSYQNRKSDLERKATNQLKAILKARGLSTSGTRQNYIDRIEEDGNSYQTDLNAETFEAPKKQPKYKKVMEVLKQGLYEPNSEQYKLMREIDPDDRRLENFWAAYAYLEWRGASEEGYSHPEYGKNFVPMPAHIKDADKNKVIRWMRRQEKKSMPLWIMNRDDFVKTLRRARKTYGINYPQEGFPAIFSHWMRYDRKLFYYETPAVLDDVAIITSTQFYSIIDDRGREAFNDMDNNQKRGLLKGDKNIYYGLGKKDYTRDELNKMGIGKLKEILKQRGHSTSGKRDDYIERILNAQ